MIRLRIPHLLLGALAALAVIPAAATAGVGGLEVADTLLTAAPAIAGSPVQFSGLLGPDAARSRVLVQGRGPDGTWATIATTTADRDGRFSAAWTAPTTGRWAVRAIPGGDASAAQAANPPTAVATVYRRAGATWYSLPGNMTACGVRMRRSTLGVANRRLPCGTLVDFSWGGRTITVPVIDRGPFGRGVSYDLTLAAARVLGFVKAGRVKLGALPNSGQVSVTPLAAVAPIGAAGGVST